MDNQQNFEQQFMQNVKTAPKPVTPPSDKPQKNLPIVSIILGIIVVLQSIALIIVLSNFFAMFNESEEVEYEDETTVEEGSPYVFDDENKLIAVATSCIADDKSTLILKKDNTFKEYDPSSSLVNSGNYHITRDSVFSFDKDTGEQTLIYDGYNLTDGTVFYNCELDTEEES
ncbi:hypothetical protein IKF92_01730 [Candidatus Saccharibacteria bacterium]|nr:hypothetical protein [Candidatus Saccharibacteria bacterium]